MNLLEFIYLLHVLGSQWDDLPVPRFMPLPGWRWRHRGFEVVSREKTRFLKEGKSYRVGGALVSGGRIFSGFLDQNVDPGDILCYSVWMAKRERTGHPIRFLTSATEIRQCPADLIPEIVIAGRSNAGKSSLINGMAGNKIAKVSQVPGKTRLINFFATPHYRWVDLPGYGYASRSMDERESWQGMIENFLSARGNISGLLLLLDVRRDWAYEEEALVAWWRSIEKPVAVCLTKTDKLTRNEILKRVDLMRKSSGVEDIFHVSSTKRQGLEELEEFVFDQWIASTLSQEI
jgi:GTP-binding protein